MMSGDGSRTSKELGENKIRLVITSFVLVFVLAFLFSGFSLSEAFTTFGCTTSPKCVIIELDAVTPLPTAPILNKWNPSGTTDKVAAVLVNEVASGLPDKSITSRVNNDHQTFNFETVGFPPGTTINKIELVLTAKKTTTQTTKLSLTVAKGTTLSDLPKGGTPVTTTYAEYKRDLTGQFNQLEISTWKVGGTGLPITFGVAQNTDAKDIFVTKAKLRINFKDEIAPVTTATPDTPVPASGWYSGSVQVALSATDTTPGSGVDKITYTLDGATATVFASSKTVTVSGDGIHTLTYQATDKVGNTEVLKSLTIQIDAVAPTTTATPSGTAGLAGWFTSAVSVTLACDDPIPGSGCGTTTYSINGGTPTAYSGAISLTADGTYTITFSSTDVAGNIETTKTLVVKIDTTPPSIHVTINGGAASTTLNGVTAVIDCSDGIGGSGCAADTTSVSTDNFVTETAVLGSFPVTTGVVLPAGRGEKTVSAQASDVAGNTAVGSDTIELLATLTVGSPSNTSPRWGVDSVIVIGAVTNTLFDDKVRVDYGSPVVDATIVGGAYSATSTYPSGSAAPPNSHIITATLINSGGNTVIPPATATAGTVTALKHAVSIIDHGVLGSSVEGTGAVDKGTVIDNDDPTNTVNGVTVLITDTDFINFPDPVTTGIKVTDGGSGLTISGGVLTVNPNTTFDIPFGPTEVNFAFSGILTAGDIVMDVTYNDPANPGATVTSILSTSVPAGNPTRGVSFGSGIVSVKIVSFPDLTLGISNIQTLHNGNLMQDVGISGLPNTSGPVVTGGGSTYASSATLGSPGAVQVTAQSLENVDYLASLPVTIDVAISADTGGADGKGGNVAVSTFNGKIFAPYNCGDTTGTYADNSDGIGTADNDNDFICDRWETLGIPFTINNYVPGAVLPSRTESLPLGATTNPSPLANDDIWIEEDYFVSGSSTHKTRSDAVDAVKAAFQAKGIYLHVTQDDSITESAATSVWTDTNFVYGNDFNTIKAKYFGAPAERATISFVAPATDAVIGAPSACVGTIPGDVTVDITAIQISTSANALYGDDVSGKVAIQFKLTLPGTFGTVSIKSITMVPTTTGLNLAIPSMTPAANSRIDVTALSNVKIITILVPFSVTQVIPATNLGTVRVTITEGTCGITTTSSVSGAVAATTSMQDAKAKAFHYLLSIHSIGTCVIPPGTPSGRSESLGNDMVVSLGCGWSADAFGHSVGTKNEQAGTLMHEIGHNLYLNHGGPEKLKVAAKGVLVGGTPPDRADNCKPNMVSIMTYSGQVPGYKTDPATVPGGTWRLDYSAGTLPDIEEAKLKEFATGYVAVAGSPTIVWANPAKASLPRHSTDVFDGGTIDWNIDGAITGSIATPTTVSVDVNDFDIYNCDNSLPVAGKLFRSWDEWSNLDFNLRATIAGFFDAETSLQPTFASSAADPNADAVQGAWMQTAVMFGMIPPPSLLGDEVRNAGASLPLKFKLFKSDGVTLITFGEGFAVVTKRIGETNTVETVATIGPFLFNPTGLHHSFVWDTPTTTGQYYITIKMKVPGSTDTVTLFDALAEGEEGSSSTHPILRDAAGNQVTTKVKLQ